MTDITKDMQELIAKNLSAATGGAMSDFITEAEENKACLQKAQQQLVQLADQLDTSRQEKLALNNRLYNQVVLVKREKDLAEQTEALRIRERDLQLEIAQIRLAAANDRNAKVEQLVDKVFGHPSSIINRNKTIPVAVKDSNGLRKSRKRK